MMDDTERVEALSAQIEDLEAEVETLRVRAETAEAELRMRELHHFETEAENARLREHTLTDAEWVEFQSIPEQGYSHRAWVDAKIEARLDELRARIALARSYHGRSIDPTECQECETESMPCRTARALDGTEVAS